MNKEVIIDIENPKDNDLISKQAVLDMLENINAETEGVGFYYEHYVEYIKNLPPVTPQPKMGQWIFDEVLDHHYYCSECKSMGVNYWDYCPYCGSYNGGETDADSD